MSVRDFIVCAFGPAALAELVSVGLFLAMLFVWFAVILDVPQ